MKIHAAPHVNSVDLTLHSRFDLDSFVETGTYFGVTLGGLIGDFERLISVEISKSLHDTNTKKFQGQKHVTLLQGDSRLRSLLHTVTLVCLRFRMVLNSFQVNASQDDSRTACQRPFTVS